MAGFTHQALHFGDRLAQTGEHRTGNDGVADIQLFHLRNRRNRLHVVVMQAVAGIHPQTLAVGITRGFLNARQLGQLFSRGCGIGITTGVDLDVMEEVWQEVKRQESDL